MQDGFFPAYHMNKEKWLLTYNDTLKHMNKHYRERFHVDALTAARDLQELGVNLEDEFGKRERRIPH